MNRLTIISGERGAGKTTALLNAYVRHLQDNGPHSATMVVRSQERVSAVKQMLHPMFVDAGLSRLDMDVTTLHALKVFGTRRALFIDDLDWVLQDWFSTEVVAVAVQADLATCAPPKSFEELGRELLQAVREL